MTNEQQQNEQQQNPVEMHNAIKANPAMESIVMRYKMLGYEYFSLEHTIANYLRHSGFIIDNQQINPLFSLFIPLQRAEQENKSVTPIPEKVELKMVSMSEAKDIVLDILVKESSPKTSRQIKEKMNIISYDVNKHSLKAVLTDMKKEGLIEKETKGWIICKTKQHKPLKKV